MNNIFSVIGVLALVAFLFVAVILPMSRGTENMGENAVSDLNVVSTVLQDSDIYVKSQVVNDLNNKDITVTVYDNNNNTLGSLTDLPENAMFELTSETYDKYGNVNSRDYTFKAAN